MKKLFFVALLASLLFTLSTHALATEPAVSKLNGRAEVLLGDADVIGSGNDIWNISGNVAIPVTKTIGTQVDLGFGELDVGPVDADLTNYGLHLFTRNPELGLAGIFASRLEVEDLDIDQIGVEGEFYSGPMTIAALLGHRDTDFDDDLIGSLDLRWYPMDELMLEVGASFIESNKKLHLGAEYQLLQSLASYTDLAFSGYADLAVGNDDYDHALIGLRAYFGSPKNLTKRHREDQLDTTTNRLK